MAKKRVDFVITEKGAGKAKKGFQDVDRSMASAAKSAAKYAAAYIGVSGIIRLTKASIEAFGIQEQAEKRLETALGGVNKELLKQASALQKVTTFGDEAIIGVQASIAAFTDNTQEIKEATKATLDLAIANGFDLKSAGDLVAKTLGSSTNALTRYGVEVTGAVGSTERLTTLTEGIARLWGGQAAAAADTMAGQLEQASNAAGDAGEAFGELLAPRVIEIAGLLEDGAEAVIEFIESFAYQEDVVSTWSDDLTRLNSKILQQTTALLNLRTTYGANAWETQQAEKRLNETTAERTGLLKEISNAEKELQNSMEISTEDIYDMDEAYAVFNMEIEKFKELAPAETWEDIQKSMETTINTADILAQSLGNAFNPDIKGGDAMKEFVIQLMNLMEGVILASEAVSTALTFTFTGPLGVATALSAIVALEGAKALVRNADFAATGADFTTSGPQLLMVGDNPSGRERVQVTPMGGDPNINGPQGGTFNFYGDIIGTDEFVESNLIPSINRAVTQGRAALA